MKYMEIKIISKKVYTFDEVEKFKKIYRKIANIEAIPILTGSNFIGRDINGNINHTKQMYGLKINLEKENLNKINKVIPCYMVQ